MPRFNLELFKPLILNFEPLILYLEYKCCVSKSLDMSRDHFVKNCKLLTNWWPV